jgi:hypothetical protein
MCNDRIALVQAAPVPEGNTGGIIFLFAQNDEQFMVTLPTPAGTIGVSSLKIKRDVETRWRE